MFVVTESSDFSEESKFCCIAEDAFSNRNSEFGGFYVNSKCI